ncbi:hypothetical protein K502DRAFT_303114 [Neoconidiobolus thromboides FSU 785]|nr:hypothetical protein K502DRAFT_303114 [Neoconidiobolus thromboides FSU 785]
MENEAPNQFKKVKRSKNLRKRAVTPDKSEEESHNINLITIKKKKEDKEEIYFSNKINIDFKADESKTLQSKLKEEFTGATATAEIDTEFSKDGRALMEKKLANKEITSAKGDSAYKGKNAYNTYVQTRESTSGSIAGSKMKAGPIRAANNIRITNRFDYQPDICKDYKETGFCGYGDSCKFLHDRGDYKSGWQLEREWEEEQTAKRDRIMKGVRQLEGASSSEEEEEELPFACLICRKPFTNPVVTKCGHYFCEQCALKKFQKTPKCFACNAQTGGIFDIAKNIIEKMNQMKKSAEEDGETGVEIQINQNSDSE